MKNQKLFVHSWQKNISPEFTNEEVKTIRAFVAKIISHEYTNEESKTIRAFVAKE